MIEFRQVAAVRKARSIPESGVQVRTCAVQDFGRAFVRCGSKQESASLGLMSAPTSCGRAAARGYASGATGTTGPMHRSKQQVPRSCWKRRDDADASVTACFSNVHHRGGAWATRRIGKEEAQPSCAGYRRKVQTATSLTLPAIDRTEQPVASVFPKPNLKPESPMRCVASCRCTPFVSVSGHHLGKPCLGLPYESHRLQAFR